MNDGPAPEALDAIRAWLRLETARRAFGREAEAAHGVTGFQLALLRIIGETDEVLFTDLRRRLGLHPATFGQVIERLSRRGVVETRPDPVDRRRRLVRLTAAGREACRAAPLAGPVRLRYTTVDPQRLRRLTAALDDALDLFAWRDWTC